MPHEESSRPMKHVAPDQQGNWGIRFGFHRQHSKPRLWLLIAGSIILQITNFDIQVAKTVHKSYLRVDHRWSKLIRLYSREKATNETSRNSRRHLSETTEVVGILVKTLESSHEHGYLEWKWLESTVSREWSFSNQYNCHLRWGEWDCGIYRLTYLSTGNCGWKECIRSYIWHIKMQPTTNWPLLTIQSPAALWLEHPTRWRRVVGVNLIRDSKFFSEFMFLLAFNTIVVVVSSLLKWL